MRHIIEEAEREIEKNKTKEFGIFRFGGSIALDLSFGNLTSWELKLLIPLIEKKLPNLKKLYLYNMYELKFSGLVNLPENIENLTKLTYLDLHNTQIESLPESIGSLTKLTHLNLSYCSKLRSLPHSIRNLPELKFLNLNGILISLKDLLNLSTKISMTVDVNLNNEYKQTFNRIRSSGQVGEFRSIATAFTDAYPNISVEDFNTLSLRLNTHQIRGILEFELPLRELGIGHDSDGKLSNELDESILLPELFSDIDRIAKAKDISSKKALNFLKNDPEISRYKLAVLDYGLNDNQWEQMRQLSNYEEQTSILNRLGEEIIKENYGGEVEEFHIGELTQADKDLAKSTFDEIIQQYLQPQTIEKFFDSIMFLSDLDEDKQVSKVEAQNPKFGKNTLSDNQNEQLNELTIAINKSNNNLERERKETSKGQKLSKSNGKSI